MCIRDRSKDITIAQQDFKNFTQPAEKSIIVMNPPYGERISTPVSYTHLDVYKRQPTPFLRSARCRNVSGMGRLLLLCNSYSDSMECI